ncbi:MAG: Asp-tRNA(Asn)/Glu-tRNA(Gln) amidotransferase subunit GatA [Patescibacteria group bacterium]
MNLLHNLTIKKFHEGLLNKEFSALEITQAFFSRIKDRDKEIHAFLELHEENAAKAAEKVDLAVANGEVLPLLAGAPLAIKDNILIDGTRTTAGSKILENYFASYDAHVIKKLKSAGAVFLGKTNLDEFAMGASTENSAFGVTKNPYDLHRVPGGSSGGSASAVAANMALAGLGSDTGGSVRQPAAFCGIVGFKPTYGAVSRHGLIAMASSLDQIGPITKTVEDAALLFEAIYGKDNFDATSADYKFSNVDYPIEQIRKLRIGIPKEYFVSGLDKTVSEGLEEALKKFRGLKIEFKEVSLPHSKYALSVYYIIMPAEASTNLARFDGIRYGTRNASPENLVSLYRKNRGAGFGREVRRRILLGTFVLSAGYYDAYYAKAQKVRQLIKEDFDRAFDPAADGVDVILTPTTPTPAFKIGEKTTDPLQMYLSDIFTIPENLAGLPAISIPVKKYSLADPVAAGELPIGFQLVGKHFHEADILNLGKYYEKI